MIVTHQYQYMWYPPHHQHWPTPHPWARSRRVQWLWTFYIVFSNFYLCMLELHQMQYKHAKSSWHIKESATLTLHIGANWWVNIEWLDNQNIVLLSITWFTAQVIVDDNQNTVALMKATDEHCISEQFINSLLYFQHAIHYCISYWMGMHGSLPIPSRHFFTSGLVES